jgi:molybdate transport system ATP-binding protein
MTLEIDIDLALGAFRLRAAFATTGGVTAFFGPSGAGKTSLGLLVAGLLRPDRGRIALNGRVLADTDARIWVPPHRRRIAAVFQDGRLFPHLSVRQNLAYGAWFNRTDRSRFQPVVELLGLESLLARRPATLSGGEQRRVAIGRALLAGPELLVLDEPLTGLDAARREEILSYLERLRDTLAVPMILISHISEEIVRLADRILQVADGRVIRSGPLAAIMPLLGPGNEAGAVVDTIVERIDSGVALATLSFDGGQLLVPAAGLVAGARLRLLIRAADIGIALDRPERLSILNAVPAVIAGIEPADEASVDVALMAGATRLVARITRLSAMTLRLETGMAVYALVKSVAFTRQR